MPVGDEEENLAEGDKKIEKKKVAEGDHKISEGDQKIDEGDKMIAENGSRG